MTELRAPRAEEAAAIAPLMSAHSPEPATEERVRLEWSSPGVDLERDVRLAVGDGAIVGCVAVERLHESRSWLELHGERADELEGAQPAPEWPEGVAARTCSSGDEQLVYETHAETFEDSWEHVRESYEEWAHWWVERPGFDPTLWFIATAKDDVAGIALCRGPSEAPDTGWIGVLGVRRAWRRQGLGRSLLLHAFRDFVARGCSRAALGVDAESLTGANLLYERVGMRPISTYDLYARR